jgi:hypothetical protein
VDGAVWVLLVLAAVLVLVALVVFVSPLARSSSAPAADRSGTDAPASRPTSPSGSLARGFGYLSLSPRQQTRRGGVHERLARAFARIDAVDPHAAPRRIGEALVQAGLADPARRAAPEPSPDVGRRAWTEERPRDVG